MSLLDGLVGRLPGSVGETSVLALALGGAFLLWRGVITWHVPAALLGSVAALAAAFSAVDPARFAGAGFHLVTGGLVLGALFMATDYVTSPLAPRGMLVYGAGCGLLTWLIRTFGGYPEGVSFAILLHEHADAADRHLHAAARLRRGAVPCVRRSNSDWLLAAACAATAGGLAAVTYARCRGGSRRTAGWSGAQAPGGLPGRPGLRAPDGGRPPGLRREGRRAARRSASWSRRGRAGTPGRSA